MKKITIIGNYNDKGNKYNGQTVKTKILTKTLKDIFDEKKITTLDTSSAKKHPIIFTIKCIIKLFTSDNIIILPAQSAINFLVPLLNFFNKIFRRKIHYYVVGGWLLDILKKNKKLEKPLKKITGIYVELRKMESDLIELGFENIYFVNKFREIEFISKNEIKPVDSFPIKLCFFSRVMYEKGIEDLINSVINVNSTLQQSAYILDIYGPIDDNYIDKFNLIKTGFPKYINYCGVVDYSKSNLVLKKYDLMVFPTFYEGEGYANVIVDAFASGLPVIATDWKYNCEVIRDGIDGLIYPIMQKNKLDDILIKLSSNLDYIYDLKLNTCDRSDEYKPQNAIEKLIENIRRN